MMLCSAMSATNIARLRKQEKTEPSTCYRFKLVKKTSFNGLNSAVSTWCNPTLILETILSILLTS